MGGGDKKLYRVFYLSRDRFPGERAHSINQIRMCDAFADLGLEIFLVCPRHSFNLPYELSDFYGLNNSIKVIRVPCISFDIPLPKFLRKYNWLIRIKNRFITDIAGATTTLSIITYILYLLISGKLKNSDLIYGRSAYFSLCIIKLILFLFSKKNKVVIELHKPLTGRMKLLSFILKKMDMLVVISEYLKNIFTERNFDNVVVLQDGVDIRSFVKLKNCFPKRIIREKLNLPLNKKIICYSGHLYPYKGVDDLIKIAQYFKEEFFLIVGGFKEDVDRCSLLAEELGLSNIFFTGFLKPSEVPKYLYASDICVYTFSKESPEKNYTSPIKLFEYLASGNPTVAANVPGVREIIKDGENGLLYEPGNIEDLKKKIEILLKDLRIYNKISEKGFESAKEYTWEKRAQRVLDYLK